MPPPEDINTTTLIVTTAVIFVGTSLAVFVGWPPLVQDIRRRERFYEKVLRGNLLLNVSPRVVTVLTAVAMVLVGGMGYAAAGSWFGMVLGAAVVLLLPKKLLKFLQARRVEKLENQLVGGITTLSSGVRAGLNLVQAMELLARDGPVPLKQEFLHLVKEYEYGVSLEEAMSNAAVRIDSGDFHLLFAALLTHRERGGDLGETLDRIGESLREIQRLEGRVKSLTAQGRATSRFLGLLVGIVMLIVYLNDTDHVRMLFVDNLGKLIIAAIIALLSLGFLWIRKIVAVDI